MLKHPLAQRHVPAAQLLEVAEAVAVREGRPPHDHLHAAAAAEAAAAHLSCPVPLLPLRAALDLP